MLTHNYKDLIKTKLTCTKTDANFNKTIFVVSLKKDLSMQPIGGYLDNAYNVASPIEQTYTMANAGYVIYEKIIASLKKHNAIVYRLYNKNGNFSNIQKNEYYKININILGVEYYRYNQRTKNKLIFDMAKIDLAYSINKEVKDTISIKAKTNTKNDIFDEVAEQFTDSLYKKINI